MIVTVTVNPAIDRTAEIDTLARGALNRIRRVQEDAGGKGINVSRTICALGGQSIAAGFLAGTGGEKIEKILKNDGISCDFIRVAGETRINTKVIEKDGTLTELNEPGPKITEGDVRALLEKLDGYAAEETLFVLSGSVPAEADKTIYARIIRRVHEKGAKVLVDADGALLCAALEEGPDMLKPNRAEIEAYVRAAGGKNGPDRLTEQELWEAAAAFAARGAKYIVVSMGGEGALFLLDGFRAKCPALKVPVRSCVGAGDAVVAAMACAFEQKMGPEDTVRLCMAASAGAVATPGTRPPAPEYVKKLMAGQQICIL